MAHKYRTLLAVASTLALVTGCGSVSHSTATRTKSAGAKTAGAKTAGAKTAGAKTPQAISRSRRLAARCSIRFSAPGTRPITSSSARSCSPGPGSLLGAAAAASPAGTGSAAVSRAGQDAKAWYATSGKVFALDLASSYADETRLVIGTGTGSSAAAFARLETDIRRGIAADQVMFRASAAAGSTAFGGLEIAIVIAVLLMILGSAWGLSPRLAEYR